MGWMFMAASTALWLFLSVSISLPPFHFLSPLVANGRGGILPTSSAHAALSGIPLTVLLVSPLRVRVRVRVSRRDLPYTYCRLSLHTAAYRAADARRAWLRSSVGERQLNWNGQSQFLPNQFHPHSEHFNPTSGSDIGKSWWAT